MSDERTITKRLSDDGERIIIVERWLDRQHVPPRWRSKNRHIKLDGAGYRVLPPAPGGV